MGCLAVAEDTIDFSGILRRSIYKAVRDAHLQKTAMHDQTPNRAPALGARMSPDQQRPAGGGVVTNSRYQMGGPDPGA